MNSSITRNKVKWVWDRFLEVAFPRTCIGCGRLLSGPGHRFICNICANGIDWISDPSCTRCGAQIYGKLAQPGICPVCRDLSPQFDQCKSLFQYRGMGARLIHVLKYEGGTWLRPQIEEFLNSNPLAINYLRNSVIVPVPLHWWKLNRRGYNQAEVIAVAAASVVPETSVQSLLMRIRSTGSQTFLKREGRLRNMRNAFRCRELPCKGKKIVLVDDVLTTGATLNAAAVALKLAGADKISAFTMAHG